MSQPPIARNPEELAQGWGWPEPPAAVLDLARRSIEYQEKTVGAIVVQLGLATQERIDETLRSKPPTELTLSWLTPRIEGLRRRYHEILALKSGLPYLSDLADFTPHAALENEAVAAYCEGWGARLYQLHATTVLAFTDFDRLATFRRIPERTRRADALHRALDDLPQLAVIAPGARAQASAATVRMDDARRPTWDARVNDASPAHRALNEILDTAINANATDVKIDPMPDGGARVLMRVMGLYLPSPAAPDGLSPALYSALSNSLLRTTGAWDKGSAMPGPKDGEMVYRSAVTEEADIRLAATPLEPRSPRVLLALRILVASTGSVELGDLALQPAVATALHSVIAQPNPNGLIIVCGPTGSGKSTTLAGAIGFHYALHGTAMNRLSMETPPERKMPGVITQIHVPRDRYEEYYPTIVRSDPDLLLLGEIRDRTTAEFGVSLANTGHLLLSTLHADHPAMALRSLAARVDAFRHPELYACTRVIVGQRLVRGLCDCAKSHAATDEEHRRYQQWQEAAGLPDPRPLPETLRAPSPKGCDRCADTHHAGYRRMLPVNEVLPISAALRDRLIDGELPRPQDHTLSFAASLRERLQAGEIDLGQVLTPEETPS